MAGSHGSANPAALRLRIVQGPLKPHENRSILCQYNALAAAEILMTEFERWVQGSPAGPAWHALLESNAGEIVGHTSLIPIRATSGGRSCIGAKSEYSFIQEEFRAAKIRGFEQTGRLKNLIYIDELFKKCRSLGWSPLLISTSASFHRVFRSIGCYPVGFPLWECLLVLRPGEAARKTPNLEGWKRAALWGTGLAQRVAWTPSLLFSVPEPEIREGATGESAMSRGPVAQESEQQRPSTISFFEDQESLTWRYPADEYARIAQAGAGADVIVKHGGEGGYLRVCQWRLKAGPPTSALVARLVRMARQEKALGVRWSVYGEGGESAGLVKRLRRLGFLCVRRVRTLLVNSAEARMLEPSAWNLTDAMFSFDHYL